MTEQSEKTHLPLRHFIFFHRAMLISTDTQFSTHTDVKVDADTLCGYMQLTVSIMHSHFPGKVIQEVFVWDISRSDRKAWEIYNPDSKRPVANSMKLSSIVARHELKTGI